MVLRTVDRDRLRKLLDTERIARVLASFRGGVSWWPSPAPHDAGVFETKMDRTSVLKRGRMERPYLWQPGIRVVYHEKGVSVDGAKALVSLDGAKALVFVDGAKALVFVDGTKATAPDGVPRLDRPVL
ncbi:MAG: hypothetical protein AAF550_11630 [Myxococcota bacterium]